jgi:Protein of unknown function (DUF2786)
MSPASRIKALLAKTVARGATEAEELAAAEKARELIEKYRLNLGTEEAPPKPPPTAQDLARVAAALARFLGKAPPIRQFNRCPRWASDHARRALADLEARKAQREHSLGSH